MQNAIDLFNERLDDKRAAIVTLCGELIDRIVPEAELRYSFKIPFYHYFGMFCYMNKVNSGIELCFCRGKDLLLVYPQLQSKSRNTIAGVTIESETDIIRLEIAQLVAGAAEWQKEAKQIKKPFVNSAKKPLKKRPL